MSTPTPRKAALIVVDMQEDFCKPHGALGVEGGRELAPKINELLRLPGFTLRLATRDYHPSDHTSFASQHGVEAFTEHKFTNPKNEDEAFTTKLWPDHCIQGTRGCELIPELDASHITKIISKGTDRNLESYSGFGPPFRKPRIGASDLEETLKEAGITDVFTVGLAFDYCVKWTALDAAVLGYRTFVIEDASNPVSRFAEDRERTRKAYLDAGVVLISSDSEELGFVRERKV